MLREEKREAKTLISLVDFLKPRRSRILFFEFIRMPLLQHNNNQTQLPSLTKPCQKKGHKLGEGNQSKADEVRANLIIGGVAAQLKDFVVILQPHPIHPKNKKNFTFITKL